MSVSDRRKHFMEAVGEHLPSSVYFHGTSHENAESIARGGFHLENETHGRHSGEGVYIHKDPLVAAQHGQAVVAVKLARGTRIPTATDRMWANHRAYFPGSRFMKDDGSGDDPVTRVLKEEGFHGHRDPDDGSVIVHDPAKVKYVNHYARPEGFDEQAYINAGLDNAHMQ